MALARKTDAPLKPVGVPLNVRRDANKWRLAMRKVDQGQSRKDLYALKTKIFTRGWQVIDKRSQQAKAKPLLVGRAPHEQSLIALLRCLRSPT